MFLRFLQKVPTFKLLLPYILGVLLVSSHLRIAWSLLLFALWGLLLYEYLKNRMGTAWSLRWIPGLSLVCLWICMGAFSESFQRIKSAFPLNSNQNIAALVSVESVPLGKPKSYQCEVHVIHSNNKAWKGKHLQLYIAKDRRSGLLDMGDDLLVYIKPQKPVPPSDPRAFNYAGWLQKKGICATAYVSSNSWKLKSKGFSFNLKKTAEKMRAVLLSRFRNAGISGEEYSLVSALTLGSVNLLTPETKQQFSVSGVSHILSVSGLHVAIVYAVLEFMLSFFNRFEKMKVFKQLLIILILWCYAFMTGLSPSVIRSAFMFSMLAFGQCLHRKSQTINTVLFSAFVLLLWNPSFLYDLGFELSYCAVLSIVVLHSRMKALWTPSSKIAVYFWEMICLSAVAQLGTAPLTIFYFHQFPNYFLLNNLVAVPFSGLIIYLACAFLLLGKIPFLDFILTWCLNGSLYLFQWFVKTTSELPFALTENIEIQKMDVVLLYALMGTFFVWFFLKRRKWILAVLFCVLCLQGLALSQYFKPQKKSDLVEMCANLYLCKKRNAC